MSWPQTLDYNAAIQNLQVSFCDPELRQGDPVLNALGLPMPRSGNFADVYEIRSPAGGQSWAVKCFKREVPGLQERYREIAAHLKQVQLPFMVDFDYVERGVLVRGAWYPVLKMRWVEGFSLNQFVGDYLQKPNVLRTLLRMWTLLAQRLREAAVAHGDLQHGNVLLVPVPNSDSLGLRLIDYDGMFVPSLASQKPAESGHPSFQHPHRARDGFYSGEVDRFSHLVICCAIRSLIARGRALWDKFDNGDNLLFREEDFQAPATSPLFQELWTTPDVEARSLAGHLLLASVGPIADVPVLDSVMVDGRVQQLTAAQTGQVDALLRGGALRVRTVAQFTPEPAPGTQPAGAAADAGTGPWWLSWQSGKPAVQAPYVPRVVLRPSRYRRTPLQQVLRHSILPVGIIAAVIVAIFLGIPLAKHAGKWLSAQLRGTPGPSVPLGGPPPLPAPPPPSRTIAPSSPSQPAPYSPADVGKPTTPDRPAQQPSASLRPAAPGLSGNTEQPSTATGPPLDPEQETKWSRWAREKADSVQGTLIQRAAMNNGEIAISLAVADADPLLRSPLSSYDAIDGRYCLGAGRLYLDDAVYSFGDKFDSVEATPVQEIPGLAEALGLLSVHVELRTDEQIARVVVHADASLADVRRDRDEIERHLATIAAQRRSGGPSESTLRRLGERLYWNVLVLGGDKRRLVDAISVPANRELLRLNNILKIHEQPEGKPRPPALSSTAPLSQLRRRCRELSIIIYKSAGK